MPDYFEEVLPSYEAVLPVSFGGERIGFFAPDVRTTAIIPKEIWHAIGEPARVRVVITAEVDA